MITVISNPYPLCRMTGEDDQIYMLMEDFVLEFDANGKRYLMVIKEGYCWGGGHIPTVGWSVIGIAPHGSKACETAFLLHDMLYESQLLDKDTSDSLMREMILMYGGADTIADIIFGAVDFFGIWAYNEDAGTKDKVLPFVVMEEIKDGSGVDKR